MCVFKFDLGTARPRREGRSTKYMGLLLQMRGRSSLWAAASVGELSQQQTKHTLLLKEFGLL